MGTRSSRCRDAAAGPIRTAGARLRLSAAAGGCQLPVQSPNAMARKFCPLTAAASGSNATAPGWHDDGSLTGMMSRWLAAAAGSGTKAKSAPQACATGPRATMPTTCWRM